MTTRVESRAQNPAHRVSAPPAPPAKKGKAFENQTFSSVLRERQTADPARFQAGRPLAAPKRPQQGEQLAPERPLPPLDPASPHHERQHREETFAPALDPLARSLAGMRPWTSPAPPPAAAPLAPNATLLQMEQTVTRLVRRVAWGGDGARGTARIELGAGELAGATITVRSDARELSVDVDLPPGVPAGPWRDRLLARLEQRGFAVRELNVT